MAHIALPRRRLLLTALSGAALAPWASLGLAGPSGSGGPRFVLVILRGGMDGLYAVPALGDPEFAAARGALGQYAQAPLKLDATFSLHPLLGSLHAMHQRGELSVVHAVGLPYHERSHFDAQQVLESGGTRPFQLTTGWLARALGPADKALALNTAVPLVLRGPGNVDTWAPSVLPDPSSDLISRLATMYAGDAALATALARARTLRSDMAADGMAAGAMTGGAGARAGFPVLAQRAAEFLNQPDGPQAAVLELGGWDSHTNQTNPNAGTAAALRNLDTGLAALREALVAGGTWSRTVVVVATEFGREVAINGTQGSDHGSGGAAFVTGGAVKGGCVIADWPGLARRERFEGRDLRTTTDLRAVLKGVLSDHLRVATRRLDAEVFPGSESVRALSVLG